MCTNSKRYGAKMRSFAAPIKTSWTAGSEDLTNMLTQFYTGDLTSSLIVHCGTGPMSDTTIPPADPCFKSGDTVQCVTGSSDPCSGSGGGSGGTVQIDPTANTVQLD